MSGFEAVAADIRSAAEQINAAASEVLAADPSGRVGEVSGAMPGSQSAAAAGRLVDAWKRRFEGWSTDGDAQGTRMTESADAYDASDYRADQDLRLLMIRTGEY